MIGQGYLSTYAAAKRLVILFRPAQSTVAIEGILAAEVDVLEEAVWSAASPEAVVETLRDTLELQNLLKG